jgi:hypothetical protein
MPPTGSKTGSTAVLTIAGGIIIMSDGLVTGKGGTIFTTEQGKKSLSTLGIPALGAEFASSLFFNAPETYVSD